MSYRPPYNGGRPPPAYGMQQGWSFTGPPPGQGYPASVGQVPHYPQMPAAGPGVSMQPHAFGTGHVPAGPMFHHAHSHFPQYGAPQHFMPRPPQMQPHATTHYPQPRAQKYANKKERDKAKRERKEARKLAENPLQEMTQDAQPREFLNTTEKQETLVWIADRKANFPSAENRAKRRAAAAALAQSGASEARSGCDDRLFAVLQEQHKRGLLRTAGTEDLFRSAARRRDHGPPSGSAGVRPAAPSGAARAPSSDTAAAATPADGAHAQPPDHGTTAAQLDAATDPAQPASGDGVAQAEVAAGVKAAPPAAPSSAEAGGSADVAPGVPQQGGGLKRGPPGHGRPGQPAKRHNRQGGSWAPEGPAKGHLRPCLLHRLVSADVRQDRNLLLQVIRFFVANDFLQGVDTDSLRYPEGPRHQS